MLFVSWMFLTAFLLAIYIYTKGNGLKVGSEHFSSDFIRHFNFSKVAKVWSGLPQSVVMASGFSSFTSHIDSTEVSEITNNFEIHFLLFVCLYLKSFWFVYWLFLVLVLCIAFTVFLVLCSQFSYSVCFFHCLNLFCFLCVVWYKAVAFSTNEELI